jgi:hypothetical protein
MTVAQLYLGRMLQRTLPAGFIAPPSNIDRALYFLSPFAHLRRSGRVGQRSPRSGVRHLRCERERSAN